MKKILVVISCLFISGLWACDCDDTTVNNDCTCDPDTESCCKADSDCDDGYHCEDKCRCVENGQTCYTHECTVGDDCSDLGSCFSCTDGCCVDMECESDDDCPPENDLQRYCPDEPDPETGCRVCLYVRCETDEECEDPNFPLYQECQADQYPRCSRGTCICDQPCGGECPGETFCCKSSNTCDPLPNPCEGVECPECEQVNPEPDGTLNDETCVVDGADCSCVPLPALPDAFAGLYSAIALGTDGVPVLSGYYGNPYGDLIFGIASSADAGATVTWTFVDGVPQDAPCEGDANGPRGGIAEPGDDVGWDTDIAVGSDGNIHISYYDRTNGDLKYAIFDRTEWQAFALDSDGDTGRFTSIGLLSDDTPLIAYMTVKNSSGQSQLKVAWAPRANPTPEDQWQIFTLDAINAPCAPGDCEEGQACLESTASCTATDDPATCNDGAGCADGEACVATVCEPTMPDSSLEDIPAGTGLFASLVFYSDGSPAVVYYDSINGDLKYVAWNGTDAFDAPVVIASDGNVGADCSAFITSDDVLHVVYQDADVGDLYYWNSQTSSSELVDMGARDANGDPTDLNGAAEDLHWVGNFAKVLVDEDGNVRVAYQDGTSLDLVVATRNAAGVWTAEILARKLSGDLFEGAYGFFTDEVLGEGGIVHISNFKHNLRTDPPSSTIDLRTHVIQ